MSSISTNCWLLNFVIFSSLLHSSHVVACSFCSRLRSCSKLASCVWQQFVVIVVKEHMWCCISLAPCSTWSHTVAIAVLKTDAVQSCGAEVDTEVVVEQSWGTVRVAWWTSSSSWLPSNNPSGIAEAELLLTSPRSLGVLAGGIEIAISSPRTWSAWFWPAEMVGGGTFSYKINGKKMKEMIEGVWKSLYIQLIITMDRDPPPAQIH